MPELRCPVGDFTARGSTLAEAALALSKHLTAQHCDMPPEDVDVTEAAEQPTA